MRLFILIAGMFITDAIRGTAALPYEGGTLKLLVAIIAVAFFMDMMEFFKGISKP